MYMDLSFSLTFYSGGRMMAALTPRCTGSPHIHTTHYLNFQSHHPHHVKRGLVRCLHDRARNITSSQENLNREERHIATVLNITATLMASSTPPPSHNPPRTLSIEKRNKRALTCSDPHW